MQSAISKLFSDESPKSFKKSKKWFSPQNSEQIFSFFFENRLLSRIKMDKDVSLICFRPSLDSEWSSNHGVIASSKSDVHSSLIKMSRSKVDLIIGWHRSDTDTVDVVTVTDAACLLLLSFYPISLRDIISTVQPPFQSQVHLILRVYKLS